MQDMHFTVKWTFYIMPKRSPEYIQFSYGRSLLQIAEDVNSTAKGTMDRDHVSDCTDVMLLREALTNWEEPVFNEEELNAFDRCVKSLVQAAIGAHEYRERCLHK
jgi:hypothetical protein